MDNEALREAPLEARPEALREARREAPLEARRDAAVSAPGHGPGHTATPAKVAPSDPATLVPASPFAPGKRAWWQSWKVMVILWAVIVALVWMALSYNVNKSVIAGSVVVVGLVSNAFAWLLGVIALVPVIGPLIVKVLSIGFIWILNAVGYLVSLVAIKRGYSRDVLTYRGVTIAMIIGIVIGYVLGKLV